MRTRPAGGDQRFDYVPYGELIPDDQSEASRAYQYREEWLRDEDFLYPVRKDGRLAAARRHVPRETAESRFQEHAVREVMES